MVHSFTLTVTLRLYIRQHSETDHKREAFDIGSYKTQLLACDTGQDQLNSCDKHEQDDECLRNQDYRYERRL